LLGQKKVSKEKATRHSAFILRVSLLARVFGRAIPGPPKTSGILAAPLRADLAKSCDARGGITGIVHFSGNCVQERFFGRLGWNDSVNPALAYTAGFRVALPSLRVHIIELSSKTYMPKKKKLLVVVGAGASIDLGMPSVDGVNKLLVDWANIHFPLASNNKSNIYSYFDKEIKRYKCNHLEKHLRKPNNFEEVLYVMYQLPTLFPSGIFTSSISAFLGIKNLPDTRINNKHQSTDSYSLTKITSGLIDHLLDQFRRRCISVEIENKDQFKTWSLFLNNLSHDFDIGIVSLNYDNLIYKVLPELNTGFDRETKEFNPKNIFYRKNWSCLLHLHGSVHFDFWNGGWNDDLSSFPNPHSTFKRGRSSQYTTEGLVFPGSEIIAGYGKSLQIMNQPFRTYYAELDRLVHECDGALILGYGFSDEHINKALSNYNLNRNRPIVVIDHANDDDDVMTVRSTVDVLPTAKKAVNLFGNDSLLMNWGGFNHPVQVKTLKKEKIFETSSEPDRPLSLWYGGMQEACKNYNMLFDILSA
jgi:hypothetical protein